MTVAPPYTCRLLDVRDAQGVTDLDRAARAASAWSRSSWEHQLAQGFVTGIFYRNTLIAYAAFQELGNEAELLFITTAAEHRRKGLAAQLLEHGLAYLQEEGVQKVFLEVSENNTPARQLYDRYGFIDIAERTGYYRDESTAIIMQFGGQNDA